MLSGNSNDRLAPRRMNHFAAAWGAAEATFFFIVPDVLLSRIALQDRRRALLACVWALAGALAGGAVVWFAGSSDPQPVRDLFGSIPAINAKMIADVQEQLASTGPWAMFIGPLTGTPYKIYALEAAQTGVGLITFLLVSVPARLVRFVLVVLLTSTIASWLRPHFRPAALTWIHASAWLLFYAWYFYVMTVD